MGLPLFVAKVESDIPRKCPHKHPTTSTSPPRTSIRRAHRLNVSRTRREANDRAILRRVLDEADENPYISNNVIDLVRRAAEAAPDRTDEEATVGRRRVAAYISARFIENDEDTADQERESRRIVAVRHMESFFGRNFHDRDWNRPQVDIRGDRWYMEQPTHTRFGRIVREARGQESFDFLNILPAPTWPRNDNDFFYTGRHSNDSRPRVEQRERMRRIMRLMPRHRREEIHADSGRGAASALDDDGQARAARAGHADGLGDRVRSPSSEAWDTLLSTLTPDPQPPSASSSFASTAATRSAGVSTNTSLSERLPSQLIPDGPCDSGNEDSDDAEEASRNRLRRVRPSTGRFNRLTPGPLSRPNGATEPLTSYVRHIMPRGAENVTVVLGEPLSATPDTGSDDDEWRSRPLQNGSLPSYSAVVEATRADGPEADTTPAVSDRRRFRLAHQYRSIMTRLQNDEDVPEGMWMVPEIGDWLRDHLD